MKLTISVFALSLTVFITTVSGGSLNTANNNVRATKIAANTNVRIEAPAVTPEAVVANLYKQHDAKKSPFFQTKNRPLVDKYFTKPLANLIWKDATASKGEVGAIDGDPLYNAQDMKIKNFAIGKGKVKGNAATVTVTFTNFGKKVTVTFVLKQVNAAWKIDNIKYGNGDSLMKWLKDTYPTKTAAIRADVQIYPVMRAE